MKTIPRNKVLERWDALPDSLREALVSGTTSDFVWKTCQKEFVPDEKIYDVAGIVSFVLFGFVHPEDLAEEIKNTLNIDARISKTIADAINQRIFEPLRGALAQYHTPVPDAMTGIATTPVRISIEGMTTAPKIIGGTTFTATPGSQKNVIIGPMVVQKGEGRREKGEEIKSPSSLPSPASRLPSDIGKPIPRFEPKPNLGGPMAAPAAPVKKPGSTGEFARLALTQQPAASSQQPAIKPPVPVIKPEAGSREPGAAPAMLQSSNLPKPIQNAPDLNNPRKAVDIMAGKKFPVPLPMKPTVIEIGLARPPATSGQLATSQLRMMAGRKPEAAPAGRQITEITSENFGSMDSRLRGNDKKNVPAPAPMPIDQPQRQVTSDNAQGASGGSQGASGTPIKPIGLAPIRIIPTPPTPPAPPNPPQAKIQPSAMPTAPQPGGKVIVKDFKEGEK